jgi:hypothetical protein
LNPIELKIRKIINFNFLDGFEFLFLINQLHTV